GNLANYWYRAAALRGIIGIFGRHDARLASRACRTDCGGVNGVLAERVRVMRDMRASLHIVRLEPNIVFRNRDSPIQARLLCILVPASALRHKLGRIADAVCYEPLAIGFRFLCHCPNPYGSTEYGRIVTPCLRHLMASRGTTRSALLRIVSPRLYGPSDAVI